MYNSEKSIFKNDDLEIRHFYKLTDTYDIIIFTDAYLFNKFFKN